MIKAASVKKSAKPAKSVPASPAPVKMLCVHRMTVTGLSHFNYALHAKEIGPGDELGMVHEPDNPIDGGSIRIEFKGERIGWVPGGENAPVRQLMDAGVELTARVISHEFDRPITNGRLYVAVYAATTDGAVRVCRPTCACHRKS
jgi:hypothetical protein